MTIGDNTSSMVVAVGLDAGWYRRHRRFLRRGRSGDRVPFRYGGEPHMTRFRAGRRLLAAAVAAGLMGAVAAADPSPADRTWLGNLTDKKPAETKPSEPDGTFGTTAPKPTVYAPLDPAALQEAVRAETDALARRMEVCTKLQQVAAARGDEKLAARALELEQLAAAMYKARVARLGVKDIGGGQ